MNYKIKLTDSNVSKSVFKLSSSLFRFPISSAARSAAAGAGDAADFVLFLGFCGVSSTGSALEGFGALWTIEFAGVQGSTN